VYSQYLLLSLSVSIHILKFMFISSEMALVHFYLLSSSYIGLAMIVFVNVVLCIISTSFSIEDTSSTEGMFTL
jgi:hypothetical protein